MHFTLARIMKKNVWMRGFICAGLKFSSFRKGILALMLVAPFMISSPALAACSGPTGDAGDILFNSSGGRIMQTCNGSAWKGWPRAIAGTWKDVNVGVFHTCAIASNNSLYCWGANGEGQVGNGTSGSDVVYPTAVSGGGSWAQVAGSDVWSGGLSCGLKIGGSLFCWGKNDNGNGGKSDNLNHNVPTATTFTGTWIDMDAGGDFGCAINTANAAYCWGDNAVGQWGSGSTGSWFYDKQLVSGGYSWKNITVSNTVDGDYSFACGLKTDNTAMCWGNNSAAQLGRGNTIDSNVPVAVSGGYTWQKISAGAMHACGIRADGVAMCWGRNDFGEVGNGVTGGSYTTPQTVSTTGVATWMDIRAGGNVTCGVKTDGTGWCWGYGQEGNLGDGAVTNYNTPHEVLSGAKWKMISPAWPTCGIMTNGTLWCWGENFNAAQGLGHTNQTNIPTYVDGSSGSGCSSPAGVGGDMLFNSVYRVLQWCDGKNWNSAGPVSPTGPLAGCTSPSGTSGDLLFNSASATAQYCDGDTWRGIGPPCDMPDPLLFTAVTGQLPATVSSNIVLVSGLGCGPVAASVTGTGAPKFRVCSNATCSSVVRAYSAASTTVSNGQYIQAQVTTKMPGTTYSAAVTVGSGGGIYNATTLDYKLVFVTSVVSPTKGNLGGIAGADAWCTSLATTAGLTGTYKAWLSTNTSDTPVLRFNSTHGLSYRLLTGTVVASSWAVLVGGTLASNINVPETGGSSSGTNNVYTNVTTAGLNKSASNNCGGWASTSGTAQVGSNGSATSTWTDSTTGSCNGTIGNLYCFQQ